MKEVVLFAAFVAQPIPDFSAFPPESVQPKVESSKPKTELRLINGKIYEVPVGSPWTQPSGPPISCPNGRCPPSR